MGSRKHANSLELYKNKMLLFSIKILHIDYADLSNGNLLDSAIHGDKIRKYRSLKNKL